MNGRSRVLAGATVAWVVLLPAHVLLTGRWWPWFIMAALPPITLVAVPLLLLALVPLARPARRWRTAALVAALAAALAAGAVLAGIRPVAWATAAAADGADGAGGLKVFAWNTEYWDMTDDTDRFYAFLRAQHADVYLLQEYIYWTDRPIDSGKAAAGRAGTAGIGGEPIRIDALPLIRAAFPGYHIAVDGELIAISRLPIVATFAPPAGKMPGTDAFDDWDKVQRVDVRVGTQVLSLYNVHLPSPVDWSRRPWSSAFYRIAHHQFDQWRGALARLRADVARNPNPMVVAGDFNSPWVGGLEGLGHGLRPHTPGGAPYSASWPTREFAAPRLWRLDWALTTTGVKVTGYRFGANHGLSDHLAQEMRISLG